MSQFSVIIEGAARPGFEPVSVARSLAEVTSISEETATKLLTSGSDTTVKFSLDEATAQRYVNTLTKIGVACRAEPVKLELDLHDCVAPPLKKATPRSADAEPEQRSIGSLINKEPPKQSHRALHIFGWVAGVGAAIWLGTAAISLISDLWTFLGPGDATAKIARFAEYQAIKLAKEGICSSVTNVNARVVGEGTMSGGSEGFNGRKLPAAIVSVTATCVRDDVGDKRPYGYDFVAAYDREFDMFRAANWSARTGNSGGPRDEAFSQWVAEHFQRN